MQLKVAKFGGSSLADTAQVSRVCDIVLSDPARKIIVVSAPGKTREGDRKVTDLLIACAKQYLATGSAERETKAVIERFASIHAGFGLDAGVLDRIKADLAARLSIGTDRPEMFMDHVKAAGEDNCAWLVAAVLRARGAAAGYVNAGEAGMLLTAEYGAACVREETYAKLRVLRDRPGITVFPGFYGITPDGDTVTFPRGGSDITGSVLAAAVQAEMYENFTDVDSVFTTDPRIVPAAKPIQELTYREMRELAYAGFEVFHDEAIVPLVRAGIPICIRNTRRPDGPGTMVLPDRKYAPGMPVGIACSEGFCSIFVSKYMMNRELGFGRRLLQILEAENLSYEHTPSGIDCMSVVLCEKQLDAATEKRMTTRIQNELNAVVSVERGLSLIMVVGEGMRCAIGMAARATAALAKASVNIEMLNQGSSEISMMFGVKAGDMARAVRSLYSAFFEEGAG